MKKIIALHVYNYNEYNDEHPKLALLEITDELKALATKMKTAWDNMSKDFQPLSLASLHYIDWVESSKLPNPETFDLHCHTSEAEDTYADIASDYGYTENLGEVSSYRVNSSQLVLTLHGFKFKCYNKYNGDCYDTDSIPFEKIIG
jgi:hypothetical protein